VATTNQSAPCTWIEYDHDVRCFLLAAFGLVSFTGCGSDPARRIIDAPNGSPRDAVPDAVPDAPAVPCTYVAATSSSQDVLSYTLNGGAFASYGCAPIDPTYWMSGSGMSVTVTFVAPQARPSIRVWGMNTDDTAAMTVNGAAYSLDTSSASLSAKVVCGVSPGPDGVTFTGGTLIGANTPADGNYSYQDVTVEQPAVTSIQIATLTGAGWGFAGASVGGCAPATGVEIGSQR
jgi:hypothetical protein